MVAVKKVYHVRARGLFIIVLLSLISVLSFGRQKKHVYLIPGQGADARLFKNLKLGPEYETINSYTVLLKRGWI